MEFSDGDRGLHQSPTSTAAEILQAIVDEPAFHGNLLTLLLVVVQEHLPQVVDHAYLILEVGNERDLHQLSSDHASAAGGAGGPAAGPTTAAATATTSRTSSTRTAATTGTAAASRRSRTSTTSACGSG